MQTQPTYADLGVVEHAENADPLSYWRIHLFSDPKLAPVELLFNEEPEHGAIEELMFRADAVSVAIYPPLAGEPQTADEAAERLLAVARGMKSISDADGLSALVSSAAAYQALYRGEEIL